MSSETLEWQRALKRYPRFVKTTLAQEIKATGFTAEQVLAGFNAIGELLEQLVKEQQEISIRGLSARCFWGDSKFLDSRRNLIYDIFPNARDVVYNRKIMMSAFVPPQLKQVIFVENFDSFMSLVAALNLSDKKEFTAAVYSAGYRGSAAAIRERGESQFLTINLCSETATTDFQAWWYGEANKDVECFFWGDLDFAALRILKALRGNFPNTRAWQAAYEVMRAYHQDGLGHSPDQAKKENQKAPQSGGCDYCDHVLNPLLTHSMRFIDQEVVNKAQLVNALNRS